MEIFDKFFTFIRHICIVRYRMINTYNETSLHRELKEIYAQKYQGRTEIEIENYICDIVCNDKNAMIIEIQTSNLSKLTDKIEKLSKTHKVKLIYPLATTTYLQKQDESGKILSKRKSPKKKNIYSIFGELFSLYKLFDNKNFELNILFTEICIEKIILENPVQTPNKSRRFKKNWLTKDKKLISINNEVVLKTKKDLQDLIPKEIPDFFSSKDFKNTEVKNEANKMIWVLRKANIIEQVKKKGNLIIYKKTSLE